MNMLITNFVNEFHASQNVTPLVRTTHLKCTMISPMKYQKIIGLEELVGKFSKRKAFGGRKPRIDRLPRQHGGKSYMATNITEKIEYPLACIPIHIVYHFHFISKQPSNLTSEGSYVGGNHIPMKKRSIGRLSRWIPNQP